MSMFTDVLDTLQNTRSKDGILYKPEPYATEHIDILSE